MVFDQEMGQGLILGIQAAEYFSRPNSNHASSSSNSLVPSFLSHGTRKAFWPASNNDIWDISVASLALVSKFIDHSHSGNG